MSEASNSGELSREEKMRRMTMLPPAKPREHMDAALIYFLGFSVFVVLWGLIDPRAWFFANLALLGLFMAVRRRSRFQVPWLLETFPMLAVTCFALTTYYKRGEIFSPYEQVNTELVASVWVATIANFGFIFTCLWMIQRQAPPDRPFTLPEPSTPIPKPVLIRVYVFGLIMNVIVRHVVPGELRVVAISLGHMEIVALAIFLYQCLANLPGFRPHESKWALIGMAFWFLREVATTLFGGPIATVLGVSPLFARYVRPWVVTVAILFSLVFVPLIQGVKKEVRSSISQADYTGVPAKTIPKVFAKNFDKIILEGDGDAYVKGFDEFIDRIYITGMLYQIKSNVDETHHFAEGKTLVNSIFWNFIPRVVYPKKPITGGSSDLAREYGGLMVEEGTSVGIGSVAEFYINWGTPGAIVCMILMGAFYGFFMGKLFRHSVQPLGFVYAAMMFVSVIRPETNLADSFGGAIRALFIWYLLQLYVSKKMLQQQVQQEMLRRQPPLGPPPPGPS